MKIKLFILSSFVILLLCACQNKDWDYSDKTTILNIPIAGTQKVQLEIPKELRLTQTDATFYWKYDNNFLVRVVDLTDTATKTLATCYRDCGDVAIVISDPLGSDKTKQRLKDATVTDVTPTLTEETEVKKLPKYDKVAMQITDAGLYMPKKGLVSNPFNIQADYAKIDDSWIECRIMDYYYDDLQPILVNIISSNSPVQEWYYDGEIFYCKSKDLAIVAKSLAMNCFCIYTCTPDSMLDYALKGASKVHLK